MSTTEVNFQIKCGTTFKPKKKKCGNSYNYPFKYPNNSIPFYDKKHWSNACKMVTTVVWRFTILPAFNTIDITQIKMWNG